MIALAPTTRRAATRDDYHAVLLDVRDECEARGYDFSQVMKTICRRWLEHPSPPVLWDRKMRVGAHNGYARLNEFQARIIRRSLALQVGQVFLGECFGIGQGTISKVKLGKVWRHV